MYNIYIKSFHFFQFMNIYLKLFQKVTFDRGKKKN